MIRPAIEPQWLAPEEAEVYLGVSKRYLGNLRARGLGPRYSRLGPNSLRYSRAELDRWLSERTVDPEAPAAEPAAPAPAPRKRGGK